MLARLQKSMKEKDQGFTLIELLVVIIIIGILAAIAIPVFLNQRKKGVDASLKSDLKNAATAVETWSTDNPTTATRLAAMDSRRIRLQLDWQRRSPLGQVRRVLHQRFNGGLGKYGTVADNESWCNSKASRHRRRNALADGLARDRRPSGRL